jgi:uncharacterized protein (DUF2384 family)
MLPGVGRQPIHVRGIIEEKILEADLGTTTLRGKMMSARLQKRKQYRKFLSELVLNQRLTESMMKKSVDGWHAIESEVMHVFGNDRMAAQAWFITPAIALDGNRPADLVANGNVQLVRDHLLRLQYCVYT